MYISKVIIENYRGIKRQELNFDRFNTLIGKNDCGKSTIINSIKLFFNDDKVSQKDFNYYLEEKENIKIEIVLLDVSRDILKGILVKGEKDDGFDEVMDDFIIDGNFNIKKEWIYKESGDIASKFIKVKVNSFIDYSIYDSKSADLKKWGTSLSAEPPVAGTGNNSDLERQFFLRKRLVENGIGREIKYLEKKHNDLKGFLPIIELLKADQSIETTTSEFKGTFGTEIRTIIKNEKESGTQSTLSGIEEKISLKIKEESSSIKECMLDHISDLEELNINPTFSWEKGVEITNVEIKLKGDEKTIPLENKGSGYRRLFMVGRLRYLANKKESQNVIYLVEEPETFLHPSAQEEMLQSLISLSDTNQIFITTHSPIFLGATKQDAITLCKKENTELKYEQKNDDDFLLDIATQLGVKPSHNLLDIYESIIFVEGSNDRKFLNIASEKLGKTLHELEQSNKIAIIDGGGGSLNNFIDIMFFEKQNKKMFLIIDSDIYDSNQITDIDIQKGLNSQQEKNKELKEKFELKENSKCFILKKKNIDTYYHPKAIERLTNLDLDLELFNDNFCTKMFLKELKKNNSEKTISSKNWIKVFEEMTSEEWAQVSNGELEGIFDEIIRP